MALFDAEGLVGVLLLLFWAYAIIDVISTDESRCRNLNKGLWLVLVVILPDLGALAWVLLGRPEGAGLAPGGSNPRRRQPSSSGIGPYDRGRNAADYEVTDRRSAELDAKLDAWELTSGGTDMARREAELAARERELEIRERKLQDRDNDPN